MEGPIRCVTTDKSQSLSTWIHCCVHLSSLLGVGEHWCWCKYVYLLYAAGVYDKGDEVDLTDSYVYIYMYVCTAVCMYRALQYTEF